MAPPAPQTSTSPELKRKKSMSEKLKPTNLKKSLSKKMDKVRTSVDSGFSTSMRKLSNSFSSSKRLTYEEKSSSSAKAATTAETKVVVATAVASPTEAVKATAPAPPQPAVKPAQDTAATSEEATNQEADAKKLVSQMVQSAMAAAVSKQDDMAAPTPAPAAAAAAAPAPVVTYDAKVPTPEVAETKTKEVIKAAIPEPTQEANTVEETSSSKDTVTPSTPPGEEAEAPKEAQAEELVLPRTEAADEEGIAYEAVAEAAELAKPSGSAGKRPIMKIAGIAAAVTVGIIVGVIGPLTSSKPAPPPAPPAKKKGLF